jgi:putative drug exporter of the RND superfamily
MFNRFVHAVERRAWWVIAAWLAGAVVLTLAAPSLNDVGSQDTADFLPSDSPSQQADRILSETFPGDPTREAAIIVAARDGGLSEADRAWLDQLVKDLDGPDFADDIRGVQSAVTDPNLGPFLRSSDGGAELVIASMTRPPFSSTGTAAVENLRDRIQEDAPDGLKAHVTGIAGLAADQATGVVESFDRTAIVTVILVLVILVAIYRSVVAPLIPLVTIGLAFGVSNGVVAYVADAGLKVNTMVGTFLVVMIFGAGTDYCLFLTSRYREDLAAGDPVARTVVKTTKVIGAVIAASAATVIVGFSSMVTADFGVFKTMGPAIGIAIAVTLVAGLTLTPALLRVAGENAFWPRRFDVIRSTSDEQSPRWEQIARLIQRRPREILLVGIIALQVPAAGLGWYHQSFDLVRDLPAGADARAGFDTLAEHYPGGTISPVYVIVTAEGPITDDSNLQAVDQLTDQLRQQAGVAQVRSVTQPAGEPLTVDNLAALTGGATDPAALGIDPATTDLAPLMQALNSPEGLRLTGPILRQYPQITERLGLLLGQDGRTTRLIVALDGNPYDNAALDAIRNIGPAAERALRGTVLEDARIAIGGPSSFYADMREISNDDFRLIIIVIVSAIFVVLALLLRSLVAPIYLLATVILSYAATMGVTVAVFQGILGDPGITFWLAPFLFVILVALGADYNIFIMSRIREEADAGHEIHEAVGRGLSLTGKVITSAGIILAGTFAALLIAPLPNLRQIGFGVTVGILIDTFIVRSLLVPAATMLLGRWAFWPRFPGSQRPQPEAVAGPGVADISRQDRVPDQESDHPRERELVSR